MEAEERVKEFHFRGGGGSYGRYYEHIYPKLGNNEERLKPSQYFRGSKWTSSPQLTKDHRVPDTII